MSHYLLISIKRMIKINFDIIDTVKLILKAGIKEWLISLSMSQEEKRMYLDSHGWLPSKFRKMKYYVEFLEKEGRLRESDIDPPYYITENLNSTTFSSGYTIGEREIRFVYLACGVCSQAVYDGKCANRYCFSYTLDSVMKGTRATDEGESNEGTCTTSHAETPDDTPTAA